MTNASAEAARVEPISIKQFLETVPPGQWRDVVGVSFRRGADIRLSLPLIQLYCEQVGCEGVRYFAPTANHWLQLGRTDDKFVTYVCKNCNIQQKSYSLWVTTNEADLDGKLYKFGEDPQFGPPTPRRVLAMLGQEKEYFLKGRRAENQAMGIAAFAYYRRVVENQKQKIFEEILRVSGRIGAPKEMLADLEAAMRERQFSKAVELVKHGIPEALKVNGHNPLTLLHNALSEGLHAQSDEECLELARSIRVVLAELVERMGSALKEEAELESAVSRLLKVKGGEAGLKK